MVNLVVGNKYNLQNGGVATIHSFNEVLDKFSATVEYTNHHGEEVKAAWAYNAQGIPNGGISAFTVVSELTEPEEEVAISEAYEVESVWANVNPVQLVGPPTPTPQGGEELGQPFKNFPMAEKLAVAKYLLLGGVVELSSYTEGGTWPDDPIIYSSSTSTTNLYNEYCVRKAQNHRPDFIDWTTIPKKFEWMARNEDGSVDMFTHKPTWDYSEGGWGYSIFDLELETMEVTDFPSFEIGTKEPRQSLVKRPVGV